MRNYTKNAPMEGRRIVVLAALTDDPAATYTEIAKRIGVCRERVRQIAKSELSETGLVRLFRRQLARHYGVPRGFGIRIRNWLLDAGYAYCYECRRVLELGEMRRNGTQKINRCLECERKRMAAFYATPEGRAYNAKYRKSERGKDVARAASMRYWDKKRGGRPPLTKQEVAQLAVAGRARKRTEREAMESDDE